MQKLLRAKITPFHFFFGCMQFKSLNYFDSPNGKEVVKNHFKFQPVKFQVIKTCKHIPSILIYILTKYQEAQIEQMQRLLTGFILFLIDSWLLYKIYVFFGIFSI